MRANLWGIAKESGMLLRIDRGDLLCLILIGLVLWHEWEAMQLRAQVQALSAAVERERVITHVCLFPTCAGHELPNR